MAREAEKDAKFQTEENKKKWKMARFRPPMDFMKAKLTLGFCAALGMNDIKMEDVHKRFLTKTTMVSFQYIFSIRRYITLD